MPGHIFLIGFMCVGKTTVGRELAALLELPFIDIDRRIEKRVGALLPFIQREGEAAFRIEESRELALLMNEAPAVIATGGGTPCEGDNLIRMKSAGTVIGLEVPLDVLMPRIERAGGDRPLLFGLKGDALRARVDQLLSARAPFYAQAHITVNAEGSPKDVAARIASVLAQRR